MNKLLQFFFLLLFCLPVNQVSAKPFIVSALHGQLGNQMFEIAAAVSLSIDNDAEATFPDFITNIEDNIKNNYPLFFSGLKTYDPTTPTAFFYHEPSFTYAPIPYQPNMRMWGFFQSEKYFRHNKKRIISLFEPNKEIKKYLKEKYRDIINDPKTVSIHIRTYFKEDPQHTAFPLNGREYVEKAMGLFPADAHYIVFSDNIPWCKEALQGIPRNIRFIEGEAYHYDFYLMSICRHHIISNSSFSWWAAYLNPNSKKIVVAPKKWFQPSTGIDAKDLYPPEWVVID